MFVVVCGGAASGKSEYAEELVMQHGGAARTYLATMQLFDEEDEKRAERHRKMRLGKGFFTVECPVNISEAPINEGGAVLLECVSNLLANEMFGLSADADYIFKIPNEILYIARKTELMVVVTNDLFSDGVEYSAETQRYMTALAGINAKLFEQADVVVEVVCGLPVFYKGGLKL